MLRGGTVVVVVEGVKVVDVVDVAPLPLEPVHVKMVLTPSATITQAASPMVTLRRRYTAFDCWRP